MIVFVVFDLAAHHDARSVGQLVESPALLGILQNFQRDRSGVVRNIDGVYLPALIAGHPRFHRKDLAPDSHAARVGRNLRNLHQANAPHAAMDLLHRLRQNGRKHGRAAADVHHGRHALAPCLRGTARTDTRRLVCRLTRRHLFFVGRLTVHGALIL